MRIARFACTLALVIGLAAGRTLAAEPAGESKPAPPPLDKAWGAEEYVAFYKYIGKLPLDSYPRTDDAESGPLFKKMVASFEVEALKDPQLTVGTRLQTSAQMLQILSVTLLAYASAFSQGHDYSLEVTHLQGGTLALTRQMIGHMDEFVAGLDPNAGDYDVRIAGLTKAKRGMAMMIDGALTSITEKHSYSDEERQILCQYLLDNGPTIMKSIDDAGRQELLGTAKKVIEREENAEVRALLEAFVSASSPKDAEQAGAEAAE